MTATKTILVTGGLGFIGSHVIDLLVTKGYEVKALDNLEPQVHGSGGNLPEYYNKAVSLVKGDIRDRELLKKEIKDVDAVIHLAAAIGVGQSMYQVLKYVSFNTLGTANLLDVIVNENNDVKKVVVASSMSIYGEGKYYCENCGYVYPSLRKEEQLRRKEWKPRCPICKGKITSVPTDENKPLMPTSIYAQTKRHQEEMVLLVGRTYCIPSIALRFFNVYGTRQSLMNPYTGVVAIFLCRLLNKKPPYIFEDGNQTRDFVNVKDVANAIVLALEKSSADYWPVNVGSGKATSIMFIAERLAELLNLNIKPIISKEYRKGDIRHCFADITRAKELLNYKPQFSLEEGLVELIAWAKKHHWEAVDLFDKAIYELKQKKLT